MTNERTDEWKVENSAVFWIELETAKEQNSHITQSLVTVRSPTLSYSLLSRELTASEVKAIFTCNGDPKGDLIEWTQSKWAKEGEADFSPIRVTEFCAKPFSSDMVRWQIRGYCWCYFSFPLGHHTRSSHLCWCGEYMWKCIWWGGFLSSLKSWAK